MSTLVPLWFSCPSVFGNWRKTKTNQARPHGNLSIPRIKSLNSPVNKHPTPNEPVEPTLFPKLRIYLADFPRPHLFVQLEFLQLEDLLRLWVRKWSWYCLVSFTRPRFSRLVDVAAGTVAPIIKVKQCIGMRLRVS